MKYIKAGIGIIVILGIALAVLSSSDAGKKDAQSKDSVDKDYATELPRIAPKEPKDALASFKLHPQFRIDLVASEPMIQSPVAAEFDENGRLFVVEYPEYNLIDVPIKIKGAIKLLEDRDGDGVFDKVTTYVENLDSPVALACWDGGLFVGSVPSIYYFKDTDGDGKADLKRTIYTGFDRDKAGEAMLNSFRWGLENRFHVSTSLAGGQIRQADKKDDPAVNVRGMGFLFDPRTLKFELTTGTGQHGMTLDDWGRKFVCDNSNPCHMITYDGRYLQRNPYVQSPPASVNIAPGGGKTKLHRISSFEPWRMVRTRLRTQGIVPGSNEGGTVGGFFTGATGVTVYRGDAFPAEFYGNVFIGEVSNNLVHRARLERDGVLLKAPRADEDFEFLASSDNWFRPCQFVHAPDGTLLVIDVYRELIETVISIPPVILKHLHPESGIERGRIYRIAPKDFAGRPTPKLGSVSSAELVTLLEHRNAWHRETASRLLYQRQDRSVIAALRQMTAHSTSGQGRLRALYALEGLGAMAEADVVPRLSDAEVGVREHALRLAERYADSPTMRVAVGKATQDDDARVRWQAAFSLGAFAGESVNDELLQIARRDGADPLVRLAILSSTRDRSGDLLQRILAEKELRSSAVGKSLLASLAQQIGAANQANDLAMLLRAVDQLPASDSGLSQELMKQLVSKLPPAARSKLQTGKSGQIFQEMLASAFKTAIDSKRTVAERATAIRTLSLADFERARPILKDSLQFKEPEAVQKATLETLVRFEHAAVPALILDAWPTLSPQVRATAAETLFARPTWVRSFLDAVEKGQVKPGEIDPARINVLKASGDADLRKRADKLFAGSALSKRQDVITKYQAALKLTGDAPRGKEIFKKICSVCHRLEGVGEQIGAELAAIKDRGNDVILLNVLDPNREVLPKFLNYVLTTESGRILTGMIAAETATSITLRRADGTSETVLRVDIADLRSTGMSFMPEGLEQQIDLPSMADLLAYLNSVR